MTFHLYWEKKTSDYLKHTTQIIIQWDSVSGTRSYSHSVDVDLQVNDSSFPVPSWIHQLCLALPGQ